MPAADAIPTSLAPAPDPPRLSPATLARLPSRWLPASPDARWHRDPALATSLDWCRRYTRLHARSFHFSAFPLPPHKRHAAFAIYAFCRHVDDLFDEPAACGSDPAGARARVSAELDALLEGSSHLPFAPAFAAAARQFNLPHELFADLVDGCRSDDRPRVRVADWAELEAYCYRVASVVGLLMASIFGLRDAAGLPRAVEMGIAMQLTNILRDVARDLASDRIYLPADELAAAGISEADLRAGSPSPRWRSFATAQVARARAFYASSHPGLARLAPDGSRFAARLMARTYAGILDAIESRGFDVFSRRARVPGWKKVILAGSLALRS